MGIDNTAMLFSRGVRQMPIDLPSFGWDAKFGLEAGCNFCGSRKFTQPSVVSVQTALLFSGVERKEHHRF